MVHFYTPNGFFKSSDDIKETDYFLIIYGGLCFANTLFTLFRAFLFAYSGIRAGKYIHECLITNLSRVFI